MPPHPLAAMAARGTLAPELAGAGLAFAQDAERAAGSGSAAGVDPSRVRAGGGSGSASGGGRAARDAAGAARFRQVLAQLGYPRTMIGRAAVLVVAQGRPVAEFAALYGIDPKTAGGIVQAATEMIALLTGRLPDAPRDMEGQGDRGTAS